MGKGPVSLGHAMRIFFFLYGPALVDRGVVHRSGELVPIAQGADFRPRHVLPAVVRDHRVDGTDHRRDLVFFLVENPREPRVKEIPEIRLLHWGCHVCLLDSGLGERAAEEAVGELDERVALGRTVSSKIVQDQLDRDDRRVAGERCGGVDGRHVGPELRED